MMLSFYRQLLKSLPKTLFGNSTKSKPSRLLSSQGFDSGNLGPSYNLEMSKETKAVTEEVDALQHKINSYRHADPDLQQTIQNRLRMEWTYHSNAIEGSTLSLGDTIFFLQEGLTVEGKPLKDFLDAKNHAEALDYLYDVVSNSEERISPLLLMELNKILLTGIKETPAVNSSGARVMKRATPGHYKKMPNHVLQADGTIHRYVEPYLVEVEIREMCDWIDANLSKQHPVITAAIAHYNHVRIHPFDDGNGRGARLLMNLILLKKHLPPAVIRKEERREYLLSLNEGDKGNLNPFVQFVGKSLIYTQKIICSEIERLSPQHTTNSTNKKKV